MRLTEKIQAEGREERLRLAAAQVKLAYIGRILSSPSQLTLGSSPSAPSRSS